jgi:acetyl esterase/lipase
VSAVADDGAAQFAQLLAVLPMNDPRSDIDTDSLRSRFPEIDAVSVLDVEIAGPHGPIPARRYTGNSTSTDGPGLVWVHGGAFVSGSLDMAESHWVGMELASRGIPVLALDYQKALSGVRHPVLSDEVLAGWAEAEDLLGIPSRNLHLGGASAGANLSAGVVVRLIDEGAQLPASVLLIYPVLHSTVPPASPAATAALEALAPEMRFSPEFMRAVNLNYVGEVSGLVDPVAFPAAGDLTGFPPTLVLNAEADDLRPSGEAFAEQLAATGTSVVADFEPGTVHGYLDHPGLPAAVSSLDRIAEWLRGHSV